MVRACILAATVLLAACAAAAEPAPDEKDVKAFAEKLQADLLTGKLAEFDAAFDIEALTGRVIKSYSEPDEYSKGFAKGFAKLFALGKQIASQLGAPTGFKLLRVRSEGGETRALFRLVTASGVLDYQEYLVVSIDGKLRIPDFYGYSKGEFLSDTLGRLLFPSILAAKKKEVGLSDAEKELDSRLETERSFRDAVAKGKGDDALKLFDALPESARNKKPLMMQRIAAAEQAGPEPLKKALEDFEKAYPGDPTLNLAALDANLNRKNWDAAHKCLDNLAARVGGDAYLDFLHANVYILAEKFDDAKASAEKAIAAEPALQDPYLSLITVTLKQKTFDETAKNLARFEKQFGRIEADLTKADEYAEFVKSPAYEAWLKARPAAKPDASKDK